MKRIKIALILLIFTSILYSQNDVEIESYNRYNQPVEDQNGRINYSKFELDSFLGMEDKDVDNPASLSSNMELNSSNGADCEILWQDVISGTCIGNNNNLIPFDYENDGTIELITNASKSGFGNKGFWYILKYNDSISRYLNLIEHVFKLHKDHDPYLPAENFRDE